jgi:hypothetical protein
MARTLWLLIALLQTTPAVPPQQSVPASQSTILAKAADPQTRNVRVLFEDDVLSFVARTFGDRREPQSATEPALFARSKERSRWVHILGITTAGARLGRSWTDDPIAQRKLRTAPVGWDFTGFAGKPYLDVPLKTTASVVFPDRITYAAESGQYELHFFSAYDVPSAETVLIVRRSDLLESFNRR